MPILQGGTRKSDRLLGPNQFKIPVSIAAALQSLGESAEYIILETAGNNALDFHIAYYIGALSAAEPAAFFHIISKDSGFDPFLKYLKGKKVFAHRSTCIADIPYFKPSLPVAQEAQVEAVIADLVRRKASKPRTQRTLLSTLHALFKKEFSTSNLPRCLPRYVIVVFSRLRGVRCRMPCQANPDNLSFPAGCFSMLASTSHS